MVGQQVTLWRTKGFEVGGGPLFIGRDRWLFWQPVPGLDVRVQVSSEEAGDHPVPIRLVVAPTHPTGRVTGATLREVAIGQLERALRSPEVMAAVYDPRQKVVFDPCKCSYEQAVEVASHFEYADVVEDEDLVVPLPPRGRRDDAFYAQVGALHQRVARRSHRPAAEIAEANDVAVSTVHGWLKEYRRRFPDGWSSATGA